MKKQTIIVTGASSGIGKEIARHFLAKGDNVVINSSTAEKLEAGLPGIGRRRKPGHGGG
jgi:NAD(P)-dependent dehydrogenase (short-subunit alcohol dehydrogenase family)